MDKGAARSKKRAQQLAKAATEGEAGPSSIAASDNPLLKRLAASESGDRRPQRFDRERSKQGQGKHQGSRGPRDDRRPNRDERGDRSDRRPCHERPDRPEKPEKPERKVKPQLDEAVRYKPKAIRTSAALIWSEAAFEMPPPKETLTNVRRVDLSGSGATDVSWLEGLDVTWLSLAGCRVEKGWEAVGGLKELSVLNISGCALKSLPPSLGNLKNLKALVAMNNEWTTIDNQILGEWESLNSLIISHSPNLTSVPQSLSTLVHLSKLTFSHCPRLTAASLPDLSPLPVLRDVKMNNLPLLSTLPKHLHTWGTGDLSLVRRGDSTSEPVRPSTSSRNGDGLEVLDLGNCSLPYSAIESLFLPSAKPLNNQTTWHLRSLSLHSNPLGTTHSNYADLLQASPLLPNLQIIDARRVVERKRKGEVNESRSDKRAREKKEIKMRPSGANEAHMQVKQRSWGGKGEGEGEDGEGSEDEQDGEGEEVKEGKAEKGIKVRPDGKKRKRDREGAIVVDDEGAGEGKTRRGDKTKKARMASDIPAASTPTELKSGRHEKLKSKPAKPSKPTNPSTTLDHSSSTTSLPSVRKYDPSAQPSAVAQVIQIGVTSLDDLTPREREVRERREAKKAKKANDREERAARGDQDGVRGIEMAKREKERKRVDREERERELEAVLGVGKGGKGGVGGVKGKSLGVGGWSGGKGEGEGGDGDDDGTGLGVGGW